MNEKVAINGDCAKPVGLLPDIRGTYVLQKWESIDGKQNIPPVQKGTLTFDDHRRIFTFVGQDDSGNFSAEMYVAKYTLTERLYTETSEYLLLDHENGSKKASYDLQENTYASVTEINNGKIKFALPHPFEKEGDVVVEFAGNQMVATIGNDFVYYWEKA
jgi:hypothetical protein